MAIGGGVGKPKQTNSNPYHISNECPKRVLNAYVEVSYEGDNGIGFGDNVEHIDEFPQVKGEIMNLVRQRTLCSTKLEEFSQQNKIFETKCLFRMLVKH